MVLEEHVWENEHVRPFQDPDSRVVAAKDRVSRLERDVEAMGESERPEVDGREFAKGVPLHKQIRDGEQFLTRAKAHLAELEQERSTIEGHTQSGDSKS